MAIFFFFAFLYFVCYTKKNLPFCSTAVNEISKICLQKGELTIMKIFNSIITGILLLCFIHLYAFSFMFPNISSLKYLLYILGGIFFLFINFSPNIIPDKNTPLRNRILAEGTLLLQLFLFTTLLSVLFGIYFAYQTIPDNITAFLIHLVLVILMESVLFWNGILRVYATSIQLGIKWRILGVICGWIPIIQLFSLVHIIRLTRQEAAFEKEKYLFALKHQHEELCKTKYPLLFVHGVFFRDFHFLNYWGRIPEELQKYGATIFYGNQQSAASVAACGEELAQRIQAILQETNAGKVNIIAHSKGGLDSRYAISQLNMAPYVASLTTINTPHQGCIFADYLLDTLPKGFCDSIASKYNAALKKAGDFDPDFLSAVNDLTASSCQDRNSLLSDAPEVFCQSVGSKMNHASSGKFPLNVSYPLVKHFDGENDGLVSTESMKWGEDFIFISTPTGRGISHGDMIDLNRENISGFDVREFYVNLVHDLKERGL